MGVPKTTPYEAFYLELGVLPVSAILKGRRANYLHSILRRDKNSMLYTFFITQWLNPTKGDWTIQVKEDLMDLDIPCSFDFIKKKSSQAFKTYVKNKVKTYALKVLKSKQQKHKKMANVYYDSLSMQSYFSLDNLKIEEKKTIFRYRVRMENFGENYRGGLSLIKCPLCKLHPDNQEMAFNALN